MPAARDHRPVTPDMLADRWQCSAETIRQMVKAGRLRGFRVGRMIRIPWDAVEEIECQTSQSDACAADTAYRGQTQRPGEGGAINLRHARDQRQNQRRATDT